MKKIAAILIFAIICLAAPVMAVEEGQTITVDMNMDIRGDSYTGNKYINSEAWSNSFVYPGNTTPHHNSAPVARPYGRTNKEELQKFFPVLRRDEAERLLKGAKFEDVKDLDLFGLEMPKRERHPADMMIITTGEIKGMIFIANGLGTSLTSRDIDETAQALAKLMINGVNRYCDTLFITADGVNLFQTMSQFNLGVGGARSNPIYDLAAFLLGVSAQTGTGKNQYNQPPFIKAFVGRMVPENLVDSVRRSYIAHFLSLDRQGQTQFLRKAPFDVHSPGAAASFPILDDRVNNYFVDNYITKELFRNRYHVAMPFEAEEAETPLTEAVTDRPAAPAPVETLAPAEEKPVKVVSVLSPKLEHVYDKADLVPGQAREIAMFRQIGADFARQRLYEQGLHLIIDGHCDERGSGGYNAALGRSRARKVLIEIVLPGFYEAGGTPELARQFIHGVSSSWDNPQTHNPNDPANFQRERVTIAWIAKPVN